MPEEALRISPLLRISPFFYSLELTQAWSSSQGYYPKMSFVRCVNLLMGESCRPSKERSGCRIQGLMGPMPMFMPCARAREVGPSGAISRDRGATVWSPREWQAGHRPEGKQERIGTKYEASQLNRAFGVHT